MATLPEMLRAEQARCRQIALDHAVLGSSGAFARALIEQALHAADESVRLSNVVAMQRALDGLRRFREVPPAQIRQSVPHRAVGPRNLSMVWAAPQPPREQFFTWKQRAA